MIISNVARLSSDSTRSLPQRSSSLKSVSFPNKDRPPPLSFNEISVPWFSLRNWRRESRFEEDFSVMKASLRLFLNGFHIPGWNPLPSPTQPPVQEVLLGWPKRGGVPSHRAFRVTFWQDPEFFGLVTNRLWLSRWLWVYMKVLQKILRFHGEASYIL